jgi:CelD/BcsL family acetyltransferase involved in cellulose biosynthesis
LSTIDSVKFRFQLSDWTLFTIQRKLEVRMFGIGDVTLSMESLPAISKYEQGLMLRSVPVLGAQAGIQQHDSGGQRTLRYVLQCFPRYYIDMAQTFDEYKSKFAGKTRATIQRKLKKFSAMCGGQIQWKSFSRPDDIENFWSLARQVSAKTYQERLLDAGLPDDLTYKREVLRLAEAGNVRAFLLFHDERPVSYLFCPVHDGIVQYAYLGYDLDYMRMSVGTVLQWLALECLFSERRFRFFDFTEGASEHKRLFATGHLECANIALLKPTLANLLLAHGHYGFVRVVEAFGAWLERRHMKSRIRRWLRFGRVDA